MPNVEVDLGAGEGAQNRPGALSRVSPLLSPALVVLLAVFAIAPLTYPGSFQTQSGFNAAYNLMDLNARIGASFGWTPTFGLGYDPLRSDGPLPYFAAELLHLLGVSFDGSIKLIYALAFLVSGLGMFALARTALRHEGAGLLAAIVYIYFPYHIADVYVRGSFGESAEWALFPLGLLAVVNIASSRRNLPRNLLGLILSFALGVLTLPGLGLLFGVATVAVVQAVWRGQPRRQALATIGIGSGLILGGLLLLPGFLRNQSASGYYAFTAAFVYPFQFLTATWGTARPIGNYLDQFPFQLGIGAIGLTVLSVALLFRSGKEPSTDSTRPVLTAVIGAFAALLVMIPAAAPFWSISGATLLVEYPFQLLIFVGMALAISAGSIVIADTRLGQTPMLAALVVIPIIGVYSYLAPEFVDLVPTHPPLARFNQNEVALVDATITRPPGIFRHGATVDLNLEWQALRQVNHDYTVFVHVVDEAGQTWGGQDTKPQDGALPTTQWQVGRVISDTHTVQIDLAGPPQGYHLEVGLYAAVNGERPTTETGATEVRIDENRE